MSKILTFFFFFFFFFFLALVLSTYVARPLPANTQESNSHMPFPSNPPTTSLSEESSMDIDGGCMGLGSEECLMKRSMVAHTDYIYTQDVSGP
ncbi:hypothetical protein Q3G72_032451 [Acer saccharum]|nr:hypothetical protein Q3G72_032451 [Acer saccharum]